jgi:uncharacterized 2Fe-2S/4Fe-4S cluster protein (DUF4445 family)
MSAKITLEFVNGDVDAKPRSVTAEPEELLIDAARRSGLEIEATCGERGRCRSCRVKILAGNLPPPSIMDTVQLGHEEVQERFRLACQTRVTSDAKILIAPPKSEIGHKLMSLGGGRPEADHARMELDSGVTKYLINVELPDDENHQTSDEEEVLRQLPGDISATIPVEVLRQLPAALREQFGRVTVTTFLDEIIDIEAGDATGQKYGMAFDIGTTSVVGALIDLDTGVELVAVGGLNPQSPYGGDLMSRIAYVQEDPKRLQTLRAKILGALNGFIKEACEKADIDSRHIHKLVVVGNTCMHHIFVGIDPTYVGLAPYAPSVRRPIVLPGQELLLKTVPFARVCLLPIIAGFVGADTVAAALATRIYESEDYRALVDIGTNGEVVMGKRGRLMACSAPAGPALEGAQIRHGMRGALGAIEKVSIDGDIQCQVIGNTAPIGICGSGLIDGVAAMLDAGVLIESGLINIESRPKLTEKIARRLRVRNDRAEFVLSWSTESGNSEDISLNQSDIRQLQLAKGAICSGVMMLQNVLNIKNDQLKEVFLCGGFGNYISTRSAVRIRLLPSFPLDRVIYFGNAAGLGAKMVLLSEAERERATVLAREIEHVSLATHPDFQDIFVQALNFPPAQAEGGDEVDGAGNRQAGEVMTVR